MEIKTLDLCLCKCLQISINKIKGSVLKTSKEYNLKEDLFLYYKKLLHILHSYFCLNNEILIVDSSQQDFIRDKSVS